MLAKGPHVMFKPIKLKFMSQLQPGKVCAIAQASLSKTCFLAFLLCHAAFVAMTVQGRTPLYAGNETVKLPCICSLQMQHILFA